MSDTIIVGLISLVGVVLTALISKNSFSHELDKKMAVIETKLDGYGKSIESHNHYAQLFAESMPVLEQRMKVEEKRMQDCETKIDRLEERQRNERSINTTLN